MSKIYHKNCRWCGDPFDSEKSHKYLCPKCEEARKVANEKKKKPPNEDKLGDLQREIDEYNRQNGTALSYGQYVLRFGK